jgi:hypothetical protein
MTLEDFLAWEALCAAWEEEIFREKILPYRGWYNLEEEEEEHND